MEETTPVLRLSADACWALLRTGEVGRLALSVAGEPEIFPVNHVVDHGSVVFRTAEGSKLAGLLAAGGVAAYEADGVDAAAQEAWSVVLRGPAREITALHELLEVEHLPLFPWQAGSKPRFVRLEPVEVSGRRFKVVNREAWPSMLRDDEFP